MNNMQIRLNKDYSMGLDVYSVRIYQDNSGKRACATKIDFETIEERNMYYPPLTTITSAEAQILMDDLWDAGIRPAEGTGSAGALAAAQSHLKDLRKIAYKLLKIKGES